MTSYRVFSPTSDSRREEFRKYLEACGVFDALTKALLTLSEEQEKPEDALRYIKQQLGVQCSNDVESLREHITNAKKELEALQKERDDLLTKIQQYESDEDIEKSV